MSNYIKGIYVALVLFVLPLSFSYAQKHNVEAVDLGLSVKWANMNVGASSPYEYGGYYAWGEIEEKRFYYGSISSKHIKVTVIPGQEDLQSVNLILDTLRYSTRDKKILLEENDDVAFMSWGAEWRIPTAEQMQELVDNCHWTPVSKNGTNGFLVYSKVNSNSIFLPLAGYKTGHQSKGTERRYCSRIGIYWTSSLSDDASMSHVLSISKGGDEDLTGIVSMGYNVRTDGCVVRPVCK